MSSSYDVYQVEDLMKEEMELKVKEIVGHPIIKMILHSGDENQSNILLQIEGVANELG